jgi:apolipoprotein D and lipocalin family protein
MKLDINRYIGKWFEIARIKNEFEPNMTKVTALYTLNDDGTIKIVNSGYLNNNYKEIIGTARVTKEENLFKISFFSNYETDYRVIFIDEEYKYALVGGNYVDYLWILSRENTLDESIIDALVEIAKENGYNANKLVMTE